MKKIVLLLVLLICGLSNAQIIDFPDPNFKSALLAYDPPIDTNDDGEISIVEAQATTKLDLTGGTITNLSGLENFVNLTELEIVNLDITTLDLSFLTELNVLRIVTNSELTTLNLSTITQISETFDFVQNISQTSLVMPNLASVGNLYLNANTSLQSVNWNGLISAANFEADTNLALEAIDISNLQTIINDFLLTNASDLLSLDLSSLISVGKNFTLEQLGQLSTLNVSNLGTVAEQLLINNTGVSGAIDLGGLTNAGGLWIQSNLELTQLSAPNLTLIDSALMTSEAGSVFIFGNVLLSELDLSSLTDISNAVDIGGNVTLSSLNFSALQSTGGTFTLNDFIGSNLDLPELATVSGDFRFDGSSVYTAIDLPLLSSVEDIFISTISGLNLPVLLTAEILEVTDHTMTTLDLSLMSSAAAIIVTNGTLASVDLSSLMFASELDFSFNELTEISFPVLTEVFSLSIQNNQLTDLEFEDDFGNLIFLTAGGNLFETLDLNDVFVKIVSLADSELLTEVFIKNNTTTELIVPGCDALAFVCVDSGRIANFTSQIEGDGLTDVVVTDYCTFVPGGTYYTVQGQVILDVLSDGCDVSDPVGSFTRFDVERSGSDPQSVFANTEGYYQTFLPAGDYLITPVLGPDSYFVATPESFTISLPDDLPDPELPAVQDYCLVPAGDFEDMSVRLLPTGPARPGFEATYLLVYQNDGTVSQSGQVTFAFDDAVLDLVSSSVAPSAVSEGLLTFNYTDLAPFDQGVIEIVVSVNSPMDTPPVNIDDVLSFTAQIDPITDDETPENNVFVFDQVVVGSFDPNDKTCLQGETITTEEVGEYVDYLIRFENTGTFAAENIVVTDTIDTARFQIQSLQVLGGSHDFVTRLKDNFVEFIFEGINLPTDDANNDGYVLFKIRTVSSLEVGDSFSNKASIYFDFNFPIITNDAITIVEKPLSVVDFAADGFTLYPNPANEFLNIATSESTRIKALEVYNLNGQLLIEQQNQVNGISLAGLQPGMYFVKIISPEGTVFKRFLKN